MARKVRHICTLLEIPYLNNATENNKRLVIRTVANGVKRRKKKRIKNAHQVSIFLTCLKCRCQRSGHQDETGHKLELQNIPAIKQVTFSFKDVFSPHCTMVLCHYWSPTSIRGWVTSFAKDTARTNVRESPVLWRRQRRGVHTREKKRCEEKGENANMRRRGVRRRRRMRT